MLTVFDDTFAGPGTLDGHVSDSGIAWEARYTDTSPDPGPRGDVDLGLTHPLYPSATGYPIEGITAPPFILGPGVWYVTCQIDIFEPPSLGDSGFEFGLYETSDGQVCAVRLKVYDGTVQFVYQPFGAPTPPAPASVWGLVALGANTMAMVITAAEEGSASLRLLFNDVEVAEFTSDVVWPNSKPYLLLRADAPVKVTRFTVSTDAVATPEFWTNIVRSAETP